MPEWAKDWTIHEAATILLRNHPEQQAELPYERCPADQRLDTVWDKLPPDCKAILQSERDNF